MISLAIQKSLIVIIIILIIHYLLKHVLYDQSISNPEYIANKKQEHFGSLTSGEIRLKSDDEKEDKDMKIAKQINLNKDNPKPVDAFIKNNDEYIKVKDIEKFINGDKDPLHKVQFQSRKPLMDPHAHIKPSENDIFSFVLEGERTPEQIEKSVSSLSGSFFDKPHIPQSIQNPDAHKMVSMCGSGVNINPYQDMNPYNSSLIKDENRLFKNIDAVNEDHTCSSLDEVFNQTQIKNQ